MPTPMKSARLASSSVNPASRSISMSRKPRWRKARDEESAASASARACSCEATRVRSPSTCAAKRGGSRALGGWEVRWEARGLRARRLRVSGFGGSGDRGDRGIGAWARVRASGSGRVSGLVGLRREEVLLGVITR